MGPPELSVRASSDIDEATRCDLRLLWQRAFADRFDDNDAAHAFGGVHILARDSGRLIGHASAVGRRIQFGSDPWREVGYVEAVATDPDWQGRGVGRAVMGALAAEISARWPVAMLSTGRAAPFYASLGWQRWRGPSFTATATVAVADGEHGGLMILRIDPSVAADLTVAVTCEDRCGDAW